MRGAMRMCFEPEAHSGVANYMCQVAMCQVTPRGLHTHVVRMGLTRLGTGRPAVIPGCKYYSRTDCAFLTVTWL